MGMSQSYGPAEESEPIATIHLALDLGVDFFDTAEVYGPFINAELVGRALRDHRQQTIIATKFGFRIEDGKITGTDSQPEHIREVAEASLRLLQTDHIDLFYQHRVDPNVPIEDVAGAVGDLVQAGRVRYLGLSEAELCHRTSEFNSSENLAETNLAGDRTKIDRRSKTRNIAVNPALVRLTSKQLQAGAVLLAQHVFAERGNFAVEVEFLAAVVVCTRR